MANAATGVSTANAAGGSGAAKSSPRAAIPPPGMFKGYEDALPGSADRILKMTERQFEHRMDAENTMMNATVRSTWIGQLFGHSYSIIALGAAAFVAVNGHPGISIIFLGTGVAGYIRDAFRFFRNRAKTESDDST